MIHDSYTVLHVYSQPMNHCEAYLLGDECALRQLQSAITRALKNGTGRENFFCNDGEGYSLFIKKLSEAEKETITLPYQDDFVINEGMKPFQFFIENS